jgi:hypothetical protein
MLGGQGADPTRDRLEEMAIHAHSASASSWPYCVRRPFVDVNRVFAKKIVQAIDN